jgi:hypothetical protein
MNVRYYKRRCRPNYNRIFFEYDNKTHVYIYNIKCVLTFPQLATRESEFIAEYKDDLIIENIEVNDSLIKKLLSNDPVLQEMIYNLIIN